MAEKIQDRCSGDSAEGITVRILHFLVIIIVAFSFAYLTYERNKVWQNDIALWTDAVEKAPENARAHNNLGRAFGAKGRVFEAVEEFKKAIGILPNYALAHMNIAVAYSTLNMPQQAEFHFTKAIELYPELSEIYYKYGLFLYSEKRYKEAIHMLNRYIELSPAGMYNLSAYKLFSDMEDKGYGR